MLHFSKLICLQVASCSKCRYEYELVSGEIYSIDSEEIRFVEVDYIYDYLLLY